MYSFNKTLYGRSNHYSLYNFGCFISSSSRTNGRVYYDHQFKDMFMYISMEKYILPQSNVPLIFQLLLTNKTLPKISMYGALV